MDASYKSILQDLDGVEYMTTDTVNLAISAVYDVLKEKLRQHKIDDIDDDDVMELSEDIIHELCIR